MPNNNNNIFGLKNLPKNVVAGPNVPTGNLLGLNAEAPASVSVSAGLPANLRNLAAPYDAAFFFDNDTRYISQVSACAPKIKSHKVAGREYLRGTPIGGTEYKNFMANMSGVGEEFGRTIAVLIALQGARGVPYEEMIDIGSGIAPMDIAVLKTWIGEHTGQKLAILIDYDRTLTQIEGSYLLGNSFEEMKSILAANKVPSDTLTVEGFVEYYTGGHERMEMLQKMFDDIYATPNLSVFILTNNPACFRNEGLFREIIGVLTKGRPFGLLCSAQTGSNKKVAIQQGGPMLKGLCPAAGGRRRIKKTKKHHKKRRLTRRR